MRIRNGHVIECVSSSDECITVLAEAKSICGISTPKTVAKSRNAPKVSSQTPSPKGQNACRPEAEVQGQCAQEPHLDGHMEQMLFGSDAEAVLETESEGEDEESQPAAKAAKPMRPRADGVAKRPAGAPIGIHWKKLKVSNAD